MRLHNMRKYLYGGNRHTTSTLRGGVRGEGCWNNAKKGCYRTLGGGWLAIVLDVQSLFFR